MSWGIYPNISYSFIYTVPIGGRSTNSVLRDRLIVYTKSKKQNKRTFYMYDKGCIIALSSIKSDIL